jgi:ketosteroid isomerase-like protein
MKNENLAVMERFKSAVASGDWEASSALMDADFAMVEPKALPYGGTYKGGDGFKSCLQKIKATLVTEALDHKRTYLTDDPNHIVGEFVVRGRLVATGAAYTSTIFERWDFRNGKVLGICVCWFDIPAFEPR